MEPKYGVYEEISDRNGSKSLHIKISDDKYSQIHIFQNQLHFVSKQR